MQDTSLRPRRPRVSAAVLIGGTALAAGVFGGVVGFMMSTGAAPPETTRAVFAWGFVIALALSCLVTIPYWRRLDEAAREAHKSAWLWGGGAAYVLAAAAAAALIVAPDGFTLPSISERTDAAGRAADAILLTVVLQSFGYGVGWLVWWLRKR